MKRHAGLSCSQVLPAPTWKSLVLEDWICRREAESDLTGGLHPKWCEDDVLQHRVNIPVSSLERTSATLSTLDPGECPEAKRSSLPVSTAATFNYPDGWSDAAR